MLFIERLALCAASSAATAPYLHIGASAGAKNLSDYIKLTYTYCRAALGETALEEG